MNTRELKQFLDYKSDEYNRPEFISSDPVQIPHRFIKKEDIEIISNSEIIERVDIFILGY